MSFVVRFQSDLFDVSREAKNPINDIPGESLLLWLAKDMKARFGSDVSEPDVEDWGWYSQVVSDGRSYMLGASASDDKGAQCEWVLQIVKDRTFVEKLLGRAKMTSDEGIVTKVMQRLAEEPAFAGLSVD